METQSAQKLKRRKFLVVLPLLCIPFITLAFWALGGGPGKEPVPVQQEGMNKELPEANLAGGPTDKMSMYKQAAKDSIEKKEQAGFDPYKETEAGGSGLISDGFDQPAYSGSGQSKGGFRTYEDPNEAKVKDRLASLERALREPAPQAPVAYGPAGNASYPGGMGSDLEKLEQMMQSVGSGAAGADPEMVQLSKMLEQIQDIQNPARAQLKLQELSQKNKGRVYAVSTFKPQKEAALINRTLASGSDSSERSINAFYSLGITAANDPVQTAIPAVIHETQTLVSGSTVKMRLLEDILINGTMVPAGNFIFGTCSVSGERLKIAIDGLRYGKSLFPVGLTVYDLDALEGIHIPGAITRDAAKDGAGSAMQGLQFMSTDPSMAAQTAGVGVEVAKGLFTKKAKLIRVTVKAGYPLLLMDAKAKQENSN